MPSSSCSSPVHHSPFFSSPISSDPFYLHPSFYLLCLTSRVLNCLCYCTIHSFLCPRPSFDLSFFLLFLCLLLILFLGLHQAALSLFTIHFSPPSPIFVQPPGCSSHHHQRSSVSTSFLDPSFLPFTNHPLSITKRHNRCLLPSSTLCSDSQAKEGIGIFGRSQGHQGSCL